MSATPGRHRPRRENGQRGKRTSASFRAKLGGGDRVPVRTRIAETRRAHHDHRPPADLTKRSEPAVSTATDTTAIAFNKAQENLNNDSSLSQLQDDKKITYVLDRIKDDVQMLTPSTDPHREQEEESGDGR